MSRPPKIAKHPMNPFANPNMVEHTDTKSTSARPKPKSPLPKQPLQTPPMKVEHQSFEQGSSSSGLSLSQKNIVYRLIEYIDNKMNTRLHNLEVLINKNIKGVRNLRCAVSLAEKEVSEIRLKGSHTPGAALSEDIRSFFKIVKGECSEFPTHDNSMISQDLKCSTNVSYDNNSRSRMQSREKSMTRETDNNKSRRGIKSSVSQTKSVKAEPRRSITPVKQPTLRKQSVNKTIQPVISAKTTTPRSKIVESELSYKSFKRSKSPVTKEQLDASISRLSKPKEVKAVTPIKNSRSPRPSRPTPSVNKENHHFNISSGAKPTSPYTTTGKTQPFNSKTTHSSKPAPQLIKPAIQAPLSKPSKQNTTQTAMPSLPESPVLLGKHLPHFMTNLNDTAYDSEDHCGQRNAPSPTPTEELNICHTLEAICTMYNNADPLPAKQNSKFVTLRNQSKYMSKQSREEERTECRVEGSGMTRVDSKKRWEDYVDEEDLKFFKVANRGPNASKEEDLNRRSKCSQEEQGGENFGESSKQSSKMISVSQLPPVNPSTKTAPLLKRKPNSRSNSIQKQDSQDIFGPSLQILSQCEVVDVEDEQIEQLFKQKDNSHLNLLSKFEEINASPEKPMRKSTKTSQSDLARARASAEKINQELEKDKQEISQMLENLLQSNNSVNPADRDPVAENIFKRYELTDSEKRLIQEDHAFGMLPEPILHMPRSQDKSSHISSTGSNNSAHSKLVAAYQNHANFMSFQNKELVPLDINLDKSGNLFHQTPSSHDSRTQLQHSSTQNSNLVAPASKPLPSHKTSFQSDTGGVLREIHPNLPSQAFPHPTSHTPLDDSGYSSREDLCENLFGGFKKTKVNGGQDCAKRGGGKRRISTDIFADDIDAKGAEGRKREVEEEDGAETPREEIYKEEIRRSTSGNIESALAAFAAFESLQRGDCEYEDALSYLKEQFHV